MYHFYIMREGLLRQDLELLAVGSPKIFMDASADIKTALHATFQRNPQADLLTDHIVCVVDGQSCGEFVVCECKMLHDGDCQLWQIEAYDQGVLVARNRQESRRCAQAGDSYMELIQQLLSDCGIERVVAEQCSEVLLCDREWEIGTKTLDMINQLLEEIGFDTLWFDSEGNARLQRYCPPSTDKISHLYRSGDSLLEADCVSTWDVFSPQNVFVAVADSPDRAVTWTATASNDDPNSPISTVRVGRTMAPVIVVENVASQAALQTYVDRIRDESMLSAQQITFHTAICLHQVNELVALEHPQLDGIYRETAWIMDLAEGKMTHEGRSVYFL